MKTKNPIIPFLFYFLLSTVVLLAQTQSEENTSSPLMIFEKSTKDHGERKSVEEQDRFNEEQRSRTADPQLLEAQRQKQEMTHQKENAIQQVQTSGSNLVPADEIRKVQEQKNLFKNQALLSKTIF